MKSRCFCDFIDRRYPVLRDNEVQRDTEQVKAWTAEAKEDRGSLEDWIRLQLDDSLSGKRNKK